MEGKGVRNDGRARKGRDFLPAALAEAGLEITFQVGPSRSTLSGGGGRDICPSPPPNLAGEVETFVYLAGEVVPSW